jgi:two-component system, LytTR family, response regulator
MRALVVDDEVLARRRIRQLLAGEADVNVIGEAANGLEAVQLIEQEGPDFVVLDIQMPEVDGFGVVEAIGVGRMPPTIFVTAHEEHAVRAFDVHAVDYVLKPVDRLRFRQAISRVRDLAVRAGAQMPGLEALLSEVRRMSAPHRLIVRSGERMLLVPVCSIRWIEGQNNYARLHLDGVSYDIRQTLASFVDRLGPATFRRIHRTTVVNLDFVRELRRESNGELFAVMRDGTALHVSRAHRHEFKGWL